MRRLVFTVLCVSAAISVLKSSTSSADLTAIVHQNLHGSVINAFGAASGPASAYQRYLEAQKNAYIAGKHDEAAKRRKLETFDESYDDSANIENFENLEKGLGFVSKEDIDSALEQVNIKEDLQMMNVLY